MPVWLAQFRVSLAASGGFTPPLATRGSGRGTERATSQKKTRSGVTGSGPRFGLWSVRYTASPPAPLEQVKPKRNALAAVMFVPAIMRLRFAKSNGYTAAVDAEVAE